MTEIETFPPVNRPGTSCQILPPARPAVPCERGKQDGGTGSVILEDHVKVNVRNVSKLSSHQASISMSILLEKP